MDDAEDFKQNAQICLDTSPETISWDLVAADNLFPLFDDHKMQTSFK